MFFIAATSGWKLSVPVSTDEVGTLSNAALLLGNNWGDFMVSHGGYYYKYGLAMLYLPLFWLVKDVYLLFKLMLVVNAAMTGCIAVLAYYTLRRHLKVEDKTKAGMLSLIVGLLPTVLLYAGYPRGDVILIFMPWIILYCLLEAGSTESTRKKMVLSGFAAFAAGFAYMSHSRGVVAIIAGVMTIGIIRIVYKKYIVHVPVYLITLVVTMVADKFLSRFFKLSIWGADGVRKASGEYLSFSTLKEIFTPEGMRTMFRMCIGWTYNIFTSTAGLVCIGLFVGLFICFRMLRKKKEETMEECTVTVFSMLLFLGSFALGVLFFFSPVMKFFANPEAARADRVMFDRYVVSAIGPICLLGLYGLLQKTKMFNFKKQLLPIVVCAGVLYAFITRVAPWLEIRSFDRKYIIGLNLFMDAQLGTTTGMINDVKDIFLLTGLLALVVLIVFLLLHALKLRRVAYVLMIALCILCYQVNFEKGKLLIDQDYYEKTSQSQFINEFVEIADEFPYVLKDEGINGGKSWQYLMPEYTVISTKFKGIDEITDMIIITGTTFLNEAFYDDDYYIFNSIDYSGKKKNLPYIKGEALNKKLQELGYETTKVEVQITEIDSSDTSDEDSEIDEE